MRSKLHSMTDMNEQTYLPFSGILYEGKKGMPYVQTTFVCL
jgi:hypothetical protein